MATLDQDAKRAARAEIIGGPHTVILGGEVFHFRPTVPLEALELMGETKFRRAFELLVQGGISSDGEPMPAAVALERYMANGPDDSDLGDLLEGLYGQRPGEFAASPASSASGGRPLKPTSPATTESILPVPAGERIASALDGSSS